MIEKVKIQFYRISRCGYYRYGEENPEFGNINDILQQLKNWVSVEGKTLSETSTYETQDAEDLYKTYCFDIKKNNQTGDYVLVTWNETPTNEGRVVTVNGEQTVGDAEVNFTDLPEGSIPGYATYFWFIPERNVFASIRFHHSLLIGKSNLEKYLREYSAKFTSYVITEENEGGAEISGYAQDDEEPRHLYPDFKSYLYKKPGQIEALRNATDLISKIIRKNKLSPQTVVHRSLWQKLLEGVGLDNQESDLIEDVKVKYEIPYSPSAEEFDAMVEEWEAEHETKWDDIGFKLTGDAQIRWLSHSIAKSEYELDVERDNDEIVDSQSLLNALSQMRNVILSLVG